MATCYFRHSQPGVLTPAHITVCLPTGEGRETGRSWEKEGAWADCGPWGGAGRGVNVTSMYWFCGLQEVMESSLNLFFLNCRVCPSSSPSLQVPLSPEIVYIGHLGCSLVHKCKNRNFPHFWIIRLSLKPNSFVPFLCFGWSRITFVMNEHSSAPSSTHLSCLPRCSRPLLRALPCSAHSRR